MRILDRTGLLLHFKGAWAGACSISAAIAVVATVAFSGNSACAQTFEQAFRDRPQGRGLLTSDTFRARANVTNRHERVAQFFPFFGSYRSAPQPAPAQRPWYIQRRYQPAQTPAYERRQVYDRRRLPKAREATGRERSYPRQQQRRRQEAIHRTEETKRPRKLVRRAPPLSHKERIAALLRSPPPVPVADKGPLLLGVSIAKQTITLFDGGVPVAQGPVSTGTPSRPTPMGVFGVLEKAWWHRSNMYSAAPMPFMQRITWSGVAIHSGELPGYRASHGCIRTTEAFALKLWYATRIGARVVVSWDEISPLEITHPLLFQPKPGALPPVQPKAPPPAPEEPYQGLIGMNAPPLLSDQFDVAGGADDYGDDYADAASLSDDDPVLDHMMLAAADDRDSGSVTGTGDALASTTASPVRLQDEQQEANLGLTLPDLPDGSLALASLWDRESAKVRLPFESFQVARRAAKRVRHPKVARQPPPPPQYTLERVLRPGPISILISRKAGRVYVRKGLQPLFDAPVAITDPARVMGTHMFTAEGLSADGSKLRWTVVSPSSHPTRRTEISTVAARAALDRITLPDSALARITDLMSVGATFIVTDAGLGRTASALDSDFTVLLR